MPRYVQAAGAVVLRRREGRDEVLLVRRGKPPRRGVWSLPGGHVEPGETPLAAAAREVLEETGIAVRALRELEVVEIAGDGYAFAIHEVLCAARGNDGDDDETSRAEPLAASDADEARWAAVEDLAALDVDAAVIGVVARARGA